MSTEKTSAGASVPVAELVQQHGPAIRSAARFIEQCVAPRRCDSEGVADCVRCTTVYLARTALRFLEAAEAVRPLDIDAAAQWLMSDDTSYAAEPDFARRAARHMLDAAQGVGVQQMSLLSGGEA